MIGPGYARCKCDVCGKEFTLKRIDATPSRLCMGCENRSVVDIDPLDIREDVIRATYRRNGLRNEIRTSGYPTTENLLKDFCG